MLRRYVHGPGSDEPIVWYEGAGTGSRRFLQADERGSVIAVSDSSGASLAINRYDEYGIPQTGNLGRFSYTGQTALAEVGLMYYKARMYSPSLGRFMQTDPIGYGDGLGWYNYVGGDPVNFVDPSGLCSEADEWSDCPIVVSRRRFSSGGAGGGGNPSYASPTISKLAEPPICDRARSASDEAKENLPKSITASQNWNSAPDLRYDWGRAHITKEELQFAGTYGSIVAGALTVATAGVTSAVAGASKISVEAMAKIIAAGGIIVTGASSFTLNAQINNQDRIMRDIEARLNELMLIGEGTCRAR